MKYNFVQKPGKIRATLNQFFTQRHEDQEAKLPQKIWAFLEKIMIYYFYVSTNLDLLKRGTWTNVSNAFLLNTALLGYSSYFLQLDTLCKILPRFGCRNIRAHLSIGFRYRETVERHQTCTET